ncbi:MAG: cytochrome c [Gammaproteobacteria bacterium]
MTIRTLLVLASLFPAIARADLGSGMFTEAQVGRGDEIYRARCVSCHGADLRGNSNSPSLLGMSFLFLWEGRSLGELYTKMRSGMPTDNPGSLPPNSYADVLAYVLASNGYPPGTSELGTDVSSLEAVIIASPP